MMLGTLERTWLDGGGRKTAAANEIEIGPVAGAGRAGFLRSSARAFFIRVLDAMAKDAGERDYS